MIDKDLEVFQVTNKADGRVTYMSEVEIQENLSFVVRPVAIVDRHERATRRGKVAMVKVRWSEDERDVTWELEDKIKSTHPELFSVEVSLMSC